MDWLVILYVVLTVAVIVAAPIEARRIRDGRMRKKFKGTREEFIAKTRRQWGWIGWIIVALGALTVIFYIAAVLAFDEEIRPRSVALGVFILALGVSRLWGRRILGSPPSVQPTPKVD